MATMNISLPDDMKDFVDAEVAAKGFMTSSEYIRDLIRERREIAEFRERLVIGAASPMPDTSDAEFFAGLQEKVEQGQ